MFGLAPRARNTRQSKLQPPIAGKDGDALGVGRRVRTHPKGLTGFVRWVGPTHFSDGIWIGVELDTADGRNDGEVQGSRYFSCTRGHGVFVRPDHCVALKVAGVTPNGVPATPTPKHQRQRMNSGSFGAEKVGLPRTNSRSSLVSEGGNVGGWTGGGGAADNRRSSNGVLKFGAASGDSEDQAMLERLLASEAFSRAVDAAVSERVKAEVSLKASSEQQAMATRVDQLEQMVDDCGGAMDDIAAMIQNIHDKISSGLGIEVDARDAAGGAGGFSAGASNGSSAGGDAGGGGRDDARVSYLTQLLSHVHNMSTEAAELLRTERKEKNARIDYLSNKVRVLEEAATSRRTTTAVTPGSGLGHPQRTPAEPMEG